MSKSNQGLSNYIPECCRYREFFWQPW